VFVSLALLLAIALNACTQESPLSELGDFDRQAHVLQARTAVEGTLAGDVQTLRIESAASDPPTRFRVTFTMTAD
jgi:hypothetical protein